MRQSRAFAETAAIARTDILGSVLAGGRSSRFGAADKCLTIVGGRTLLARIVARLGPQVGAVVLNANGDARRFADQGLAVIPDAVGSSSFGPAAGLIASLDHAAHAGFAYVLTVPGDAPLFPADLARRLSDALRQSVGGCAVAASHGQRQPVFALWRTEALPRLRRFVGEGELGLWRLQDAVGAMEVRFAAADYDPFTDVDTPADLPRLQDLLTRLEA